MTARALWIALAWALAAHPLAAQATPDSLAAPQEAPRLRVRVRQVAGATLYLDVGTRHGLATGDSLPAARDDAGPAVATLVVTAASETRSVLSGPDSLRVAAGDSLTLTLRRAPPPEATEARADTVLAPRPRVAPEPAATARPPYGRVALELSGGQSWTRLGGADPVESTHTTANPALRLDLTVPGVGAGFDLRTSARLSYRYHALGAPATALRVYDAALVRDVPGSSLRATLGRFHSPNESFSGFWDGVHLRYGRSFGIGVLAGLAPDLWNERPSLDRPKVTVVADGAGRGEGWRWSGNASVHRAWGGADLADHTFVGVSQSLTLAALRLGGDVQVDQDPVAAGWRASRIGARASLRVGSGAELRASFTRRESYLERGEEPFFSARRDRISGGLAAAIGPARASADVARTRDALGDATSYTGSVWVPFSGAGRSALDASGSWWSGGFGRSWYAAPGISVGLGAATARAGYRYARYEFLDRITVDQTADLSLDLPLRGGTSASLRLRGQRGTSITGAFVDFTLQRSF